MSNNLPQSAKLKASSHRSSLASYSIGFGLSLLFTLIPFVVVYDRLLSGTWLVAVIVGSALVQLMVQLVFFLHLGRESRPRWNLIVFLFMLLVLFIVVVGSLWIMQNLDYNMMVSPEETDKYMKQESNRGF